MNAGLGGASTSRLHGCLLPVVLLAVMLFTSSLISDCALVSSSLPSLASQLLFVDEWFAWC